MKAWLSNRSHSSSVSEHHKQDIDEKNWICCSTMENLQAIGSEMGFTFTTYQLCNLRQIFSASRSLSFSTVKWINIVVKLKQDTICKHTLKNLDIIVLGLICMVWENIHLWVSPRPPDLLKLRCITMWLHICIYCKMIISLDLFLWYVG